MWETVAVVATAIAMAIGLAGVVLPILPGLWLMWVSALIYGYFAGFGTEGILAMAFITLVAAAATYLGVRVPQKQATGVGVPWWGQVIAAGCAVVGMFIIPILGAPIGFVLGVVVMQLILTQSIREGWTATIVILRSMALTSGIQLIAGFTILVTWVVWVIAGTG